MASQRLRVGVVGGSIAGCTLAAELLKRGVDVTVFERSAAVLDDRGAGISSSKPHLELLKQRGLVDDDMPVVDRTQARRAFTTRERDPRGRVLWEQPIATYGMSWGILYANLRRRVPDGVYRAGAGIVRVELHAAGVDLYTSAGDRATVDVAVFADGYASSGRQWLFPGLEMEYAAYGAWRGLLPEGSLDPDRPATEMAMHDGGHCVVYYVPGPDGDVAVGRRHLNWVWYRRMTEEQLDDTLVDCAGARQATSLARGRARPDVVAALHADARSLLRTLAADVVAATSDPFLQVVYDVRVPSHVVGRCALIGDAATIARPHTGSGAIKAAQEAMALAEALGDATSVEADLERWNDVVQPRSDALYTTGRLLGQAMVLDTPPWSSFDAARTEQWWARARGGSYVYYADDAKAAR
jgi:2-polyprenyl-6-methoxyphenol hydroxylase-like FAD-dependent oxidoreductase